MLLGLNLITALLIADSIVSPSITGLTYLGACSRMLYAMADKGQMPRWIAKLCPTHHLSKRSLLINFAIGIIVLFNSSSWASLMVITTAFNVLGYMGAPISLAGIAKKSIKTKIFTLFVFVVLSLLLSTLAKDDFLLSNTAITVMMIVYAILQYRQGKFSPYSFSFVIFLWLLMAVAENFIAVIVLACIFFYFITHRKFIALLKHDIQPHHIQEAY